MPWLLGGSQPLALQEKPWALHTTPHRCLHSALCSQRCWQAAFLHSAHKASRHPPNSGDISTTSQPGLPSFLASVTLFYNILHSRPGPLYINYSLGVGGGVYDFLAFETKDLWPQSVLWLTNTSKGPVCRHTAPDTASHLGLFRQPDK